MADEKDVAKRMMNILERAEKRKAPKDLRTALLTRVCRTHHPDIRTEFFECLEDVRQIKAGLLIKLNKDNGQSVENKEQTTEDEKNKKTPEEQLIEDITKILKEGISSPKPTIESTYKKYTFRDGSQSKFEDYNDIKATVVENDLLNKIIKLNNIFSEGLGFLGIQESSLWQRDDLIEEVNPEETTEGNNGGETKSDTGSDTSQS